MISLKQWVLFLIMLFVIIWAICSIAKLEKPIINDNMKCAKLKQFIFNGKVSAWVLVCEDGQSYISVDFIKGGW